MQPSFGCSDHKEAEKTDGPQDKWGPRPRKEIGAKAKKQMGARAEKTDGGIGQHMTNHHAAKAPAPVVRDSRRPPFICAGICHHQFFSFLLPGVYPAAAPICFKSFGPYLFYEPAGQNKHILSVPCTRDPRDLRHPQDPGDRRVGFQGSPMVPGILGIPGIHGILGILKQPGIPRILMVGRCSCDSKIQCPREAT